MSKSRGPTKAQQILAEAQLRTEDARENVRQAEAMLGNANAALMAYERTYTELVRSLSVPKRTRKPKPVGVSSSEAARNELLQEIDAKGNGTGKPVGKKEKTPAPESANLSPQ